MVPIFLVRDSIKSNFFSAQVITEPLWFQTFPSRSEESLGVHPFLGYDRQHFSYLGINPFYSFHS